MGQRMYVQPEPDTCRRFVQALALCLLLMGMLCISVSEKGEKNPRGGVQTDSYERISLYCDVEFWKPPGWSVEKNTITGDITQKTGIALDVTAPDQDADRRLSLMLLNDELPDLVSVTDETVIRQLVTSGKVWNLEEFLSKYCPSSHLLARFPQDVKEELIKRDGAWYAYPSHLDSVEARKIWKPGSAYYEEYVKYHHNYAIIWNKKLLKRLGIAQDELHTQAQVQEVFQAAAQSGLLVGGRQVIPLLMDGSSYQETTLEFLMQTFGARSVDGQGRYRDIRLSPQAKKALRFMQDAVAKGYCPADTLVIANEKVKDYISSGRVLCFIGNIANVPFSGRDWISTGAILASDGSAPVFGKNKYANKGWISTFVSKDCACPKKTAAFLDYMTSGEGMKLWMYGYEGEHYTCDAQGLIVRTREQRRLEDWYTKTGIGAWWMFNNEAWSRSVLQAPEKGSMEELEGQIYMAYGKDAHTVIYDNSPFDFTGQIPAQSWLGRKESKANAWARQKIPEVVLAKDEEEFEQKYRLLVRGMEKRGIRQIDRKKNAYYKENKKKRGSS